jgi:hypothetical protein
MHPLSRTLALSMASTDGHARVIAHADTLYLVTPTGEVWRVFDSEGPDRETRGLPRNDRAVWGRIFIGSGGAAATKIYRFAVGESRSALPEDLVQQLRAATGGDDGRD